MTQQMEGMPEPPESDREVQKFVDTVMYCLTGPLIGYGHGTVTWPEALEFRKHEVTLYRLAHAVEIEKEQMCTEFEAMLYISTATMVQPVGHEWFNIYMYLFGRWQPEAAEHIQNEWERKRPLDTQEQEMLARLRRDIFRSQMRHLKAKLRGESPGVREDQDDVLAESEQIRPMADGRPPNRAARRRMAKDSQKAEKPRKEVEVLQRQLF